MKVFCDTSVLVAACVAAHPHHARARPVLESIIDGSHRGFAARHSLAECWSALTTIPVSPRVSPAEATLLVERNVERIFALVESTPDHYRRAFVRCRDLGLAGGAVYDALLLEAAREAGVERVLTFNLRDFRRLAPDLAGKVASP